MPKTETAILDQAGVARAITRIAHEILEHNKGGEKLALIGIRTGGDHLAALLRERINDIEGLDVRMPIRAKQISRFPLTASKWCWLTMSFIQVVRFARPWMP